MKRIERRLLISTEIGDVVVVLRNNTGKEFTSLYKLGICSLSPGKDGLIDTKSSEQSLDV